jgi:hypothetical protein
MENEQNQPIKEKCDCGQCAECRGFFGTKTNGVLLLTLIVLMVIAIVIMLGDKQKYFPVREDVIEEVVQDDVQVKDTYAYTNHGFSIELPKGFVPQETKNRTEASITITLPGENRLVYVTDLSSMDFGDAVLKNTKSEKIGSTVFTVSSHNNGNYTYSFTRGNIEYQFMGDTSLLELLKTFKFVGWPQEGCEGGYEKCVDSLAPTDIVSTKQTTYEKVGITKVALEALVKKEFGTCEAEDCRYTSIDISEVTVKINGQLYQGVPLVTAVASQYDDSIGFQKTIAKLYKNESGDGVWRLSEPVITWACQPGRGHQDFSTKLCS